MKEFVYLNHAATSNQKFQPTVQKLITYLAANNHINSQRGMQMIDEPDFVFATRQRITEFFHAPDPAHVIFTPNATASLNMVLNGLLKPGDHILTTSVEHNAVTRPLERLMTEKNIQVTYLPCTKEGRLDPQQIIAAIRPETKALVMTHASNVLGTILPVKMCFKIAKSYGLFTILDSAQTAGFLPLDLAELAADVLVFTGHKGLMGLAGIGGFILAKASEERIDPWLCGGTGSASASLRQPLVLPDKYEPGTPNLMGILSLKSAIETIETLGLSSITNHGNMLTAHFLTGLTKLPVEILGTQDAAASVPVVSIVAPKLDSGELAQLLAERYQIITRSGLHCAPLAHQTAGTINTGALRFSFGWETTIAELDYALLALAEILREYT
ncbi:selenocysteine lyase SclA [Enterococcus faecalis]